MLKAAREKSCITYEKNNLNDSAFVLCNYGDQREVIQYLASLKVKHGQPTMNSVFQNISIIFLHVYG